MQKRFSRLTNGVDVFNMADLWYSIIIIFIACLFSSKSLVVHWVHGVADMLHPSVGAV